jgi:hypothetical protein
MQVMTRLFSLDSYLVGALLEEEDQLLSCRSMVRQCPQYIRYNLLFYQPMKQTPGFTVDATNGSHARKRCQVQYGR